jgi:long-chain fatty acid transport protein
MIAACGGAERAHASGFALREESAEGLGNAYAGQTAKAYNASTVYYNPAGMSRLDDDEVAGTVTWIQPDVVFHGTNSSPITSTGTVSGVTGPNDIKPAAIGSLFGVWVVDPDWRIGLSVAVPYGLRSEYRDDWVGRYQALASDLTDIDTALVASYKINDKLSIGGGPRVDYIEGRLTQAINFQGIGLGAAQQLGQGAQQAGKAAQQLSAAAQQAALAGNAAQAQALGAEAQSLAAQAQSLGAQASGLQSLAEGWNDGLGKLTGDDFGVGYTLGALYQIDDGTRLGFSYRSRIMHTLSGQVSYQTPGNLPGLLSSNFVPQNGKMKLTLPDTASVGIYHDIDEHWSVMSDIQWTDWSLFKQLNVVGADGETISSTVENWHNTGFFSLGVNYRADNRWLLHGGTAYDESPVKTEDRTARIPDSNRIWLAIGASYAVTRSADLHVGYAHLFGGSASINETAPMNTVGGALAGIYNNAVDIFSTSFAMRF